MCRGARRAVAALLRLFLDFHVLRQHLEEVAQADLCDVAAERDRKVVREIAKLVHVDIRDVLQGSISILSLDLEEPVSYKLRVLVIIILDSDIFGPLFFRNTFDALSTPCIKRDELHLPTLECHDNEPPMLNR